MITGNNDENLSLGEAAGCICLFLPNEKKNAASRKSIILSGGTVDGKSLFPAWKGAVVVMRSDWQRRMLPAYKTGNWSEFPDLCVQAALVQGEFIVVSECQESKIQNRHHEKKR